MDSRRMLWAWCVVLVIVAVAVPTCIRWVDYPLAAKFLRLSRHNGLIGKIFSGRVLVGGELCVIVGLALARIKTGHLPAMAKILLVACATSVMAYTLNDLVLKIAFGRPNPTAFYEAPLAGAFHPFRGEEFSSFPSGHMMLAGAFLGVFFRLCPGLRSAALLLLSFGGALLVLGDWHFVSDVIAGTFLGFSAGLMGGELWNQHNEAA